MMYSGSRNLLHNIPRIFKLYNWGLDKVQLGENWTEHSSGRSNVAEDDGVSILRWQYNDKF